MRIWSILLIVGFLLIPAPLQAQNKIPDKGKIYNVPYRLTDTAHVLVRVKINGKGPYNYIIDTGAPMTFVSVPVGKELGLKPNKQSEAVADRFEIEGGVVNKKVTLRVHTPFQLEGMNAMNFAGVELHGIIGYDLLARYKMEFDFTDHKMKWTRLAFVPPPPQFLKGKGGTPVELSAMGGLMKVLSWIVGKRESPQRVPGGFLGVELEEEKEKVVVGKVYAESPAAKAGLQKGDRLVQVQGARVQSLAEVRGRADEVLPGQEIEFTIERGGAEKKLTITAGEGL